MKCFVLALVVVLATRVYGNDVRPEGVAAGKVVDSMAAIEKDWNDTVMAAGVEFDAIPDSPDREEKREAVRMKVDAKRAALVTRAAEFAKGNPKSEEALAMLKWGMTVGRARYIPEGVPCIEMLAEHQALSPGIGKEIAELAHYPPSHKMPTYLPSVRFLKMVVEKNSDRTIRAQAALGLAVLAKRKFERAALEGISDRDGLFDEALKAFEGVGTKYGDCASLRQSDGRNVPATILGEVERQTFDLQNLSVGREAPDIVGEDLEGKALTLREHRGKAVLLVFWGTWCGPCMADVPHEKELVERFAGRPFVLLGVNSDRDRKVASGKVPWRSFWNGPEGTGGSIAKAWHIKGWPTVCIIDAQGVVRSRGLRGSSLDEPLAQIVGEAEQAAGKGPGQTGPVAP